MASIVSTNKEMIDQMVEAVKADFLASGGNLAYFDDATVRKDIIKRLAGESSDDYDCTCGGGSGPPPKESVEKPQETVRASPYFAALAASRARQEAKKKEEEDKTKKKE